MENKKMVHLYHFISTYHYFSRIIFLGFLVLVRVLNVKCTDTANPKNVPNSKKNMQQSKHILAQPFLL